MRDGRAAIELVAERIEGHAEGVDLTPGHLLDGGAVGTEAIGVAGTQFEDDVPRPAGFDLGVVAEAVVRIHPAVGAEPERVLIAVRVGEIERPVEDLALVGLAVVVGVGQFPDVRDRPDDGGRLASRWPRQRQDADRDVEFVGEQRRLPRPAIGAEIFEDRQAVARLFVGSGREWILDGVSHPEPATGVERHVHRLLDLRLRRHELDLEARRKFEPVPLLLGHERLGLHHRRRRGGDRHPGQRDGGREANSQGGATPQT